MSFLLTISFGLACIYLVRLYLSLKRNIQIAVDANLPYIIVPIYTGTPVWYMCYGWILPPFRLLPTAWTSSWLEFLDPYWSWKMHHEPFARLGSDTIVMVSPWGVQFCTCDPDVILEVANRRNEFCKPVESYVYLDIFGPSIVTREGKDWRAHQRMLAPAFSEQNTRLVWQESLTQARAMLGSWLSHQQGELKHILNIRGDMMSLPFNIIHKAGFGIDLPWDTTTSSPDDPNIYSQADTLRAGHTMTYRQAIATALNNLFYIVACPEWLLRVAPSSHAKILLAAHHESVAYLRGIITERANYLTENNDKQGLKPGSDVLSALVAAQAGGRATLQKSEHSAVDEEALSDRAILSNVFILLVAGHETTATILLLAFVELAIDLRWQHEVQVELDELIRQRESDTWTFDEHASPLSNSKVGATLNEIMRLYPPANIIPKGTRPGSPQTVRSGSHVFTVPANTALQFLAISAHQHPKYWPSNGLTYLDKANDLSGFRPQRWLQELSPTQSHAQSGDEKTENISQSSAEKSSNPQYRKSLFRPYPGSYIPFSIGHRACIGQRFAQVEMLAIVAMVLKNYSLELDVEDLATDSQVEAMNATSRQNIYEQTRSNMRKVVHEGFRHHLTMQQMQGKLAIRLVKRGNERFMGAYINKGQQDVATLLVTNQAQDSVATQALTFLT